MDGREHCCQRERRKTILSRYAKRVSRRTVRCPGGHRAVVTRCLQNPSLGLAPVLEPVARFLELLDRSPRNRVGGDQAVDVTNVDQTALEVEVSIPSRQPLDPLQVETLVVLIAQRR
jgi:hypothetical protein